MYRLKEKIRRRETWYYNLAYRLAKGVISMNMPALWPVYPFLRRERTFRLGLWDWISGNFYCAPVFKTYCRSCGRGLRLVGGVPEVLGNLTVDVGEGVTMHGAATFSGGKACTEPTLTIGDFSHLGYQMEIAVGDRVSIGRHVLISNRVSLVGYDAHPLSPARRSRNEPPDMTGQGAIVIDDYAWIGINCIILKNVTIGKAAVVAAGSVVTKDVESYTVVAGNPAVVVKRLDAYRNEKLD